MKECSRACALPPRRAKGSAGLALQEVLRPGSGGEIL